MLYMEKNRVDVALVRDDLLDSITTCKKIAGMVSKKSLNLTLISQHSTNDITVAILEEKGKTILLLNLYAIGVVAISTTDLRQL